MEDITDANYTHAKRVSIGLKIKKIDEYCDFDVESDTLLLADVFNHF